MKVIITESQYNKFIGLQRRISDIIHESLLMIDNGDEFYWGVDFCVDYPTLEKFINGIVNDIIQQYGDPNYDIDDTVNFIYDHIGYEHFIKILMDEHGEKIGDFYNERTKDC